MQKYQNLIGLTLLAAAVIVGSLILAEAIDDLAIHLVRVLQLK